MTPEIASEILKWLQAARETIEQQAPVLAQEILAASARVDHLLLGVGVVLLVLMVGAVVMQAALSECDFPAPGLVAVVCALVGFPMVICSWVDLMYIHTAPHWYVLHEISHMVKP